MQGEYSANLLRERILGEELEIDTPAQVSVRPPILCPGCPHRSVYHVVKKLGLHVAGDIGCYTLGDSSSVKCCGYDYLYGGKYF